MPPTAGGQLLWLLAVPLLPLSMVAQSASAGLTAGPLMTTTARDLAPFAVERMPVLHAAEQSHRPSPSPSKAIIHRPEQPEDTDGLSHAHGLLSERATVTLFSEQLRVASGCHSKDEAINAELPQEVDEILERKSVSSRAKRQVPARSGSIEVRFELSDDLIQLLAELYARTKIVSSNYRKLVGQLNGRQAEGVSPADSELAMKVAADEQSLLLWLRSRQMEFSSLRNTTFELLKEPPKGRINICSDGPKILVLPNVSDVLFCFPRDQWIEKLWSDIRLSTLHYPILALSILIFLFGTLGNVFVCLSVYRNHQLRSVTNYFIVNLAFADFLVILICLPATAIWDLTLTWFFGTLGCKLIMFLQDVSISVSVLTLTAISLDRYYAICHPLRFKSSLNQAKKIIAIIWLVSLCIMAPDLVYLRAKESEELREAGLETILYSDCDYQWGRSSSSIFQFVKTIVLYLIPLLLMLCAHYTILQTLHKASAVCHQQLRSFELQNMAKPNNNATQLTSGRPSPIPEEEPEVPGSQQPQKPLNLVQELDGGNQLAKEPPSMTNDGAGSMGLLQLTMHNKRQIESRRKAATMLSAIVIIFGICYLPVHLINSLRQFIDDLPQSDFTIAISMLAHCICYLNSAINPIIYNHMNSVFRAEFRKFLSCLCCFKETKEQSSFRNNSLQSDVRCQRQRSSRRQPPGQANQTRPAQRQRSEQDACTTLIDVDL